MEFKKIDFPSNEFIGTQDKKEMITLHHTVSNGSAQAVADWWQADKGKERVATSYIVEKNGDIYKLFDDNYSAYHIGKGSTTKQNKRSIGIELVNAGPIIRVKDQYYWWGGSKKYTEEVFHVEDSWRAYYLYAAYPEPQILSTFELVKYLCDKHNIVKSVITDYEYKKEYLDHKGITSHHNLRKDKSDVSKAFPLQRLQDYLNI